MSFATEQMQLAKQRPGVNKGGRPDTITPTTIDKAREYVEGAWSSVMNDVVPTVEGLAEYCGVTRQSVYEAEEFSYMLQLVNRLQARMVVNKGLTGEYNAAISKLILSKHGYVERTEQSNTHEVVSNASIEVATDFNAYVKQRTIAIEPSQSQEPSA